jgi:hypothetical protein
MRSANCLECAKLRSASAALLLKYNAALDAIAQTTKNDRAYADRWTDLSKAAEQLYEAQKREQVHQESHRIY